MFSNSNMFSDSLMGDVQKILSQGVGPALPPVLMDQAKKTAQSLVEVYDVHNRRDILKKDFEETASKHNIEVDVPLMNSFAEAVNSFQNNSNNTSK